MNNKTLPNGKIRIDSPADLGKIIRAKRREDGLTQVEAAALCYVGTRFFSDLENGKPSVELSKVLQVLKGLGLDFLIALRGWQAHDD